MRLADKHYAWGFGLVAVAIGLAEWLSPAANDGQTIVVTPAMREFVQAQVASNGRDAAVIDPDRALEQVIEEEILYREGVRLGLNQDDLIVKRRVVQKMRFLLEAQTPLAEPSLVQLQAWLDDHPDQFLTQPSLHIEHLFFAREKGIEEARTRAEQVLLQLLQIQADGKAGVAIGTASKELSRIPSDAHFLTGLKGAVNETTLTRELGKFASKQVLSLPLQEWSAPIESGLGMHLFKVTDKTEARQMTIAEAGLPLMAAVREAQRERMNEAALEAIMARYKVETQQ